MKLALTFKQLAVNIGIWMYILACLLFLAGELGIQHLSWVLVPALAAVISVLTMHLKTDLGKHLQREKYGPVSGKYMENGEATKPRSWFKTLWGWQVAAALALTFVTGWLVVEINPGKFFLQFKNAGGIVSGIFNPDTTALMPMIKALIETIFLALMSTIFAIPFAFLISFFAARNLMPKTWLGNSVYIIIRTIATIVRSI